MAELTRSTEEFLRRWMTYHQDHPYPTEKEMANIMRATGLERKQLTDWFQSHHCVDLQRKIYAQQQWQQSEYNPKVRIAKEQKELDEQQAKTTMKINWKNFCTILQQRSQAEKENRLRATTKMRQRVSNLVSNLKRQIYDLTRKNGELQKQLQTKSDQLQLLQSYQKTLKEKQDEYDAVIKKKDEDIKSYYSKMTEMTHTSNLLKQQLQAKDKEYNELVAMIDKKEERIREMEKATKLYKEEYQQEIQTLNNRIDNFNQTLYNRQKQYESMSMLKNELKAELECSICMDTFENPYMIPECCHRYCHHCIEESLAKSGKNCPNCRCRVTSKRVLRKDMLVGRISEVLQCNDEFGDHA